jgi:hypothetical protein
MLADGPIAIAGFDGRERFLEGVRLQRPCVVIQSAAEKAVQTEPVGETGARLTFSAQLWLFWNRKWGV